MYRIIVLLLLLVLLAGVGYLYYDGQRQLQYYQQETMALQLQLDALREEVKNLDKKVKTLDESSVQGIVREANSAIIDGWQSLVNTVEGELNRAREALRDKPKEPIADIPGKAVPPGAADAPVPADSAGDTD